MNGFADKPRSYHWRMYWDDFAERLTEAGLDVRMIEYALPPEQAGIHGTTPERFFIYGKPVG